MSALIVIPGAISVVALLGAFLFNRSVVLKAQGTDRMKELQGYIRSGAFTFMMRTSLPTFRNVRSDQEML